MSAEASDREELPRLHPHALGSTSGLMFAAESWAVQASPPLWRASVSGGRSSPRLDPGLAGPGISRTTR